MDNGMYLADYLLIEVDEAHALPVKFPRKGWWAYLFFADGFLSWTAQKRERDMCFQ